MPVYSVSTTAHFLWRVHCSLVQPGEDVSTLLHGHHRQGPQVEGRGHVTLPPNLLKEGDNGWKKWRLLDTVCDVWITVVLTAILHSSLACEADDHTVSPFIKGCAYYWPTSVRAHNICNRIGMHSAPWHVTVTAATVTPSPTVTFLHDWLTVVLSLHAL